MKGLFKGKIVTILVIAATVVLAGVAIFTALRLYQLRQASVSLTQPESEPEASGWVECQLGESTYDKSACRQKAVSYKGVAGPSDPSDSSWYTWATNSPKPLSGSTSCGIAPTKCSANEVVSCTQLTFNITEEPTPTVVPTVTVTPVPTATSTPVPTGTISPTPQPTNTPVPTATSTTAPTATSTPVPTVTTTQIAAASPTPGATLPNAGVSAPTLLFGSLGIFVILLAFILAF
jgi:hypothetical protein